MSQKFEFYEEKFDEGLLYYRTSPLGEWKIIPPMTLVERITRLNSEIIEYETALSAIGIRKADEDLGGWFYETDGGEQLVETVAEALIETLKLIEG